MGDSPHDIAIKLVSEIQERSFNEADTRHKIIDRILHEVLCWPKILTLHESFIDPGYADYRLKKKNDEDLIFLEAKKEGVYFSLPNNFNKDLCSKLVSVKTLLTDPNIKSAIEQVRSYCIEEGCEYAGITNGHEWIFFKTFQKGKNWRNLKALAIYNIKFFSEHFTDATNVLGFQSVKDGSLKVFLGAVTRIDREIFYPKEKIVAYNHEVTSNNYVRELRPLANKYFGTIEVSDPEFMDSCYVNQREYEQATRNFQNIIKDSLTPYLEEYGIQDLEDNEKGGRFGNRIAKNVRDVKTGEVIILFGGKGTGKSTFLKKLLFHNPPHYLAKYSRVAITDLLKTPEDEKSIHEKIWNQIVEQLDVESILHRDRDELLELFSDRFAIAKKQTLFGIDESSDSYNVMLNNLIKDWLADKKYVAQRLVEYWRRLHKGCIVVVDNTDQFSHDLQNFCFSTAQEVSDILDCLVIISMREERFHSSKIHGTLDAYQNSGFHISAPVTQAVFKARIKYVLSILKDENKSTELYGVGYSIKKIEGCVKLIRIFKNEFFKIENSPLNEFLTACAHGNIRMALELFRGFLISGYTNVDEMISISGIWIMRIHQVLKPVMIPDRFFYNEVNSSIPNLFQIRSKSNGSHFTGLRILKKLSDGINLDNPFYLTISSLKDYFSESFNMVEDFEENINQFLKMNLVEANNRIDIYCEEVDSIKITTYGLYIYHVLSHYFTYIELVSSDNGFFDERIANEMVELSNEDYRFFMQRKRLERVKTRLKKAKTFIEYLISEEESEKEFFGISPDEMFSYKILEHFESEKEIVIKSATRRSNR